MKLVAVSVVMLAGAIMASAGTIAEALPGTTRLSIVDEWGLGVVAVGGLLFIAELLNWQKWRIIENSSLAEQERWKASGSD